MRHRKDGVDDIVSLFNLYEQKMYYIAFSILHDSYQAEDAVMDAFMRLLEKQYRIDDPASDTSKHLIIQVTRHAAIDLYRKNRRESEWQSLSENPTSSLIGQTFESTPDQEDQIETLIGTLPPIYRDVLFYRYVRDFSTAETAAALNISEAAVRKRQERALRMLRDKKKHEGGLFDGYHFKTV